MVKTFDANAYPWVKTIADLRQVFEDWEVGPGDWNAQKLVYNGQVVGAEVRFFLPYEMKEQVFQSARQKNAEADLRSCFHLVKAMQVAHLRGVTATYAGLTYLALPPGDANAPLSPAFVTEKRGTRNSPRGPQRSALFRNLAEACRVLQVEQAADQEIVDAAYRAKARKAAASDPQMATEPVRKEMERLNDAKTFIYARRGWDVAQAEALD